MHNACGGAIESWANLQQTFGHFCFSLFSAFKLIDS